MTGHKAISTVAAMRRVLELRKRSRRALLSQLPTMQQVRRDSPSSPRSLGFLLSIKAKSKTWNPTLKF
jgi:hypothetical protein